jgi:hypothetical protein
MPHEDDAFPAQFAEEVRFAVSGPPPVPSAALASVLAGGVSNPTDVHPTDKGDLLATAASNVHGPAPQAAGLPKNWRNESDMDFSGGLLTGLLAKVSGIGTAAKAAMATVTAVTTMGLAGAAAGVLPGPAQTLVATAVNAATPFQLPTGTAVTDAAPQASTKLPGVETPVSVTVPAVPSLPAAPPVSVAASAKAGASAASAPTAPAAPAVPGVPGMPALPSVTVPPAVAGLVKNLPACVTNLLPAGGVPDPTKLATQIPACIPQVLAAANLPADVAKCVSSVLGAIGGASGMSTGSVPGLAALNVSSCVPLDATKCVSNMMGALGSLPGLPTGVPGLNSFPGLGNVTGCVPLDVSKCITSITGALSTLPSTGTAPKLDLSACMPTGVPAGAIPGFGTGLPGLSGALPFFGR